MVEPTESESKSELDRFCDAMIAIRGEIQAVIDGDSDAADNVLTQAPHTAAAVSADEWTHPYSRQQAAFPLPFVRANKVWPSVGRVDNPYGDRNLLCSCPPTEAYTSDSTTKDTKGTKEEPDTEASRNLNWYVRVRLFRRTGSRSSEAK